MNILKEIKKYSPSIHQLKNGIDAEAIEKFENKYNIVIPDSYKKWLQLYNVGEFFALPVGTCFWGILGSSNREKGELYLEDNFFEEKRVGVPDYIFMLGESCDGEIIGFDLKRTTVDDGCVVQFDVESGEIVQEWSNFSLWLQGVFKEGHNIFDYEGNEN